jgi:hypothetical protein
VVRQWSATPVSTGSNPVYASEKVLYFIGLFYFIKIKAILKHGKMRK